MEIWDSQKEWLGLRVTNKGTDPFSSEASSQNTASIEVLKNIVSPLLPGAFETEQFTYGSGDDHRRSAFKEEVKFKTPSVDGSKIIPAWKGKKGERSDEQWANGRQMAATKQIEGC